MITIRIVKYFYLIKKIIIQYGLKNNMNILYNNIINIHQVKINILHHYYKKDYKYY